MQATFATCSSRRLAWAGAAHHGREADGADDAHDVPKERQLQGSGTQGQRSGRTSNRFRLLPQACVGGSGRMQPPGPASTWHAKSRARKAAQDARQGDHDKGRIGLQKGSGGAHQSAQEAGEADEERAEDQADHRVAQAPHGHHDVAEGFVEKLEDGLAVHLQTAPRGSGGRRMAGMVECCL